LKKSENPSRWRRLHAEKKKNLFKNGQTWWDIDLKHRKEMVKFRKFDEDEEDYSDVLDELEVEAEERRDRRAEREAKRKRD
jgi:hypothetical protein